MDIITIGIDLAKNVFAAHGVNELGKPDLVCPEVPRAKLLDLIAHLPPCPISIEARSGAHHWARELAMFGHTSPDGPQVRRSLPAGHDAGMEIQRTIGHAARQGCLACDGGIPTKPARSGRWGAQRSGIKEEPVGPRPTRGTAAELSAPPARSRPGRRVRLHEPRQRVLLRQQPHGLFQPLDGEREHALVHELLPDLHLRADAMVRTSMA